jgi:hypothetical protein
MERGNTMFELHYCHPVSSGHSISYSHEMLASPNRWNLFCIALTLQDQKCVEFYCVIHGKVFNGFDMLNETNAAIVEAFK